MIIEKDGEKVKKEKINVREVVQACNIPVSAKGIVHRPNSLSASYFDAPVGLDGLANSIADFAVRTYAREDRCPIAMVNGPSGMGKSTLLQYVEQTINSRENYAAIAIAITFN